MTQSTKAFDKLIAKLQELFQLDQADLDFGIYRIMNLRRDDITQFLGQDLLPQVQTELANLNTKQFDDPFNYSLQIGTGSASETRAQKVDLVETFNWLLGLRVKRMVNIDSYRLVEGTNPLGGTCTGHLA